MSVLSLIHLLKIPRLLKIPLNSLTAHDEHSLDPWFWLEAGDSAPQGTADTGDIFVATAGAGLSTGAEARGSAKDHTMRRTPPRTKNQPVQSVSSAKFGKHCSGVQCWYQNFEKIPMWAKYVNQWLEQELQGIQVR